MKKKDIKVHWFDTAEDTVVALLELLEERNFMAADINLKLPNEFEVESAFLGDDLQGGKEWYFHGADGNMEGDIRVASLPDAWLINVASVLKEHLGIKPNNRQKLIAKVFDTLFPIFMDEDQLVSLPNDELSWIDDIDKILDGEADEDSCAAESYGNGDWTLCELYEERANLQYKVISECMETFNHMAERSDK